MKLPTKKERVPLSLEIETKLLEEFKAAVKKDGFKMREIIEWGIKEYLEKRK